MTCFHSCSEEYSFLEEKLSLMFIRLILGLLKINRESMVLDLKVPFSEEVLNTSARRIMVKVSRVTLSN